MFQTTNQNIPPYTTNRASNVKKWSMKRPLPLDPEGPPAWQTKDVSVAAAFAARVPGRAGQTWAKTTPTLPKLQPIPGGGGCGGQYLRSYWRFTKTTTRSVPTHRRFHAILFVCEDDQMTIGQSTGWHQWILMYHVNARGDGPLHQELDGHVRDLVDDTHETFDHLWGGYGKSQILMGTSLINWPCSSYFKKTNGILAVRS